MRLIFLSWSKGRSREVAIALKRLMARVLSEAGIAPPPGKGPGEDLVLLSLDLPKGGNWSQDLADSLENALAGIICVTPENVNAPWLLFEAGALIRCGTKVALFPLLLDIPPTAIDGPLGITQATVLMRDAETLKREIHDLLGHIRDHIQLESQGIHSLSVQTSDENPEAWNAFAAEILAIPAASVTDLVPEFQALFERKTFEEPFQDCVDQKWLARFAGAMKARVALENHKHCVRLASPPGQTRAYESLSSAVDGYAMAIGGLLLSEHSFRRAEDGKLRDENGVLAACDARRKAIVASYARLADTSVPIFDEARNYEELSTLEERKRRLIHPLERSLTLRTRLDPGQAQAEKEQLERARTSPWLYDRLVFYIHGALRDDGPTPEDLCSGLEFELSRLESMDEPDTLVGLYYVLEAIERRAGDSTAAFDPAGLRKILERVGPDIDGWKEAAGAPDHYDKNRKVRRLVDRLLAGVASEGQEPQT